MEDGCGVVTEEAVALDIEVIANLAARTTLSVLWDELGCTNLVLCVNEPIVDVSNPLSQEGSHRIFNSPLKHCAICRS